MGVNIQNLIHRCKNNDRAAQKALYHCFADDIMKVAMRYSTDRSEAKDIVQNSFVKMFTKLDTYDSGKGAFKSWLCRVTINEALGIKRKKKNWILDESPELTSDESIENDALSTLTLEEIRSVMAAMPESHQVIFQMHYYDELSHKEIAELLDIKESSSRGKLSRARKYFIMMWKKMQLDEVSR